jgi:cholesterol oxidase
MGGYHPEQLTNLAPATAETVDGWHDDLPAIVIGSGFGGSVTALRLGLAGIRTLVIERGQHYQYSPTKMVFGDEVSPRSESFWFRTQALWPTVPPVAINPVPGILEVARYNGITVAAGAAVGGGSLVYTGCTVQPPRRYFETLWPAGVSYRELDEVYYPLARGMVDARRVPSSLYQSDPFTHARVFDDQMASAGYPTTRAHTTFNIDKMGRELDGTLRPSAIIGESTFGNSDGVKNDMTQTYLPAALRTGNVRIQALTEVTAIHPRRHGGYLVDVTRWNADGTSAGHHQFGCRMLFLAAGSMGTTRLLVRARDTGTLPELSEHVGGNWGTNGDTIALRTFTGQPGRSQAASCVSTAFVDDGVFGIPTRIENWYSMGFDDTNGLVQFSVAVDTDNRGTWTYDKASGVVGLSDWSADKNAAAEQTALRFNQMIIDKGVAGPSQFPDPLGLTAHPLGGCEIGEATDLYGRIHGYLGLYAMDASLFPGNVGGANPSLTVMALAERNMAHILKHGQ